MAFTRSPIFRIAAVLAILTLPISSFAADAVGRASGGGASIEWPLNVSGHEAVELTVVAPDGEVFVKKFPAGRTPSFRLLDFGGNATDGQYNYQLRVVPKVSADLRRQLDKARASGDEAAARRAVRDAGIVAPEQSGMITIHNGMIVAPGLIESGSNATAGPRPITTDAVKPRLNPTVEDQVIADDLIVQGSLCVGFDCVNNEPFGVDTIRLKENNLRILFLDTSTSAGFASTDWQLVANDQPSGGANQFSIEDVTASTVPFEVEGGSPTSSIYIDNTGRIGFRNSAPALDLHVTDTDTPALRLEQTNTGGFTAQTWDVAGNEANFFVRDVTNGSLLSFRIRPGAPTSSLDISASGDVGIGTSSPTEKLHVLAGATGEDTQTFLLVENPNTGVNANATLRAKSDTATANFQSHSSTRTISRFGVTLGGWNEMLGVTGNGLAIGTSISAPMILGTNSVNRLHLDTDGDIGINCNSPGSDLVIASGSGCTTPSSSINAGQAQFTVASSRTFKENIAPVAVPDILEKIKDVDVYHYDYINGPKDRLGLIAEDFHKVFGRGSDKYIDGTEVQLALWMAVKQLSAQNQDLTDRLKTLETELKKANE